MEVTRETILKWLEEANHSREWLAKKQGVGSAAVSNWLREKNPRPIPAKAVLIIKTLMEVDLAKKQVSNSMPQNLVLEFRKDNFESICKAALRENKTPKDWAETSLNDLAGKDISRLASEIPLVAEDSAPYGEEKTSKSA